MSSRVLVERAADRKAEKCRVLGEDSFVRKKDPNNHSPMNDATETRDGPPIRHR